MANVTLSASAASVPIGGTAVELTYTADFATTWRIDHDVADGRGVRTSGTVTVYPLVTTTYTLAATGLGATAPESATIAVPVTVTVPPNGGANRLRYSAVDGIWDLDLVTGTMSLVAPIPEGATVADMGTFGNVFMWGYADHPGIYYLDANGNVTPGWTTPDGVYVVSITALLDLTQYETPVALLTNGQQLVLSASGNGSTLQAPFSPPADTRRLGTIALMWPPSLALPYASLTQVCAAAGGISGQMAFPPFSQVNPTPVMLWLTWTQSAAPVAMDVSSIGYGWIDVAQRGLFFTIFPDDLIPDDLIPSSARLLASHPAPEGVDVWGKDISRMMRAVRACDATLAPGTWALAVIQLFDTDGGPTGVQRAYWFEDAGDVGGHVVLCCLDYTFGNAKEVLVQIPAPHAPKGGGLMIVG